MTTENTPETPTEHFREVAAKLRKHAIGRAVEIIALEEAAAIIDRRDRERREAIALLGLSPENQNVANDDLLACIRDRMQAYLATCGNLETAEAELRAARAQIRVAPFRG